MKQKHDIADLAKALRLSPPVEFKFAGGEASQGIFEGYASVFGNVDSYGEAVQRGAFAASLAAWKAEGALPPLLWSHLQDEPIGRIVELREDSTGLFLRGQFNLATTAGRESFEHVKAGDIAGMSFGFRVAEGGASRSQDGTIALTSVDLLEISVVAMPANRRARITGVKSLQSRDELERLLRESGLPRGAAVKLAAGGWPALIGGEEAPELDLEKFAARIEATTRAVKSFSERN